MIAKFQKNQAVILLMAALCSLAVFPLLHFLTAKPLPQAQDKSPYLRNDPEKILLAANDDRVPCGECHTLEYSTWKETPHSTGFDTMHRSSQAQSILDRMDFKLAKRESACLTCHYTAQIQRDKARAISGVSCESCHGEARDWINIHNDYGAANREAETEAHKVQRIASSKDAGMLRPSDNLYAVAANCFECHTVPQEKLINVGRHPSGSKFELVEWASKIQHNYLPAQWSSNETNNDPSPERKRMLYVIGRVLDYEYSIRGAAEATEDGSFSKAMRRRVVSAFRELEKIATVVSIPELKSIAQLHGQVKLVPNNKSSLVGIADQIRDHGKQLGQTHNGSAWAALDLLVAGGTVELPVSEESPAETATAVETAVETRGAPAETAPAGGATTQPATTSQPANTGSTASAAPVPRVQGQKKSRPDWFRPEEYEVTAPGCNCHAAAEDWLFEDPHSRSAEALTNNTRRAVEIASLYGLSTAQMKQGNQICMQCHGTVESGLGAAQVFDGVGCESCHGPSSGYLKPHKRGDGAQYGLRDINGASARAANCATCHHITDERLLASGHSSGKGYNIASGNNAIKHWPDPDLDRAPKAQPGGDALRTAFDQIKSQRPVPQVQVAELPRTSTPATSSQSGASQAAGSQPARRRSTSASAPATRSVAPPPPRNRPAVRTPVSRSAPTTRLTPVPAVADSASVEEILLNVKKRLEEVYKVLGRNQ